MANVVKNPKAALEPHDSDIHLSQAVPQAVAVRPAQEAADPRQVPRHHRRPPLPQGRGTVPPGRGRLDRLLHPDPRRRPRHAAGPARDGQPRERDASRLQLEINRLPQEQPRRADLARRRTRRCRRPPSTWPPCARYQRQAAGVARCSTSSRGRSTAIKNREEQTVLHPRRRSADHLLRGRPGAPVRGRPVRRDELPVPHAALGHRRRRPRRAT